MKFFRGNLFQYEKTTRRLFSLSFLHSKHFPSERIQYKQNAITAESKPPSTITILIVLSRGTLLGNAPFNDILNPLYSVCIAKISLPAQFHSISIFLYYSTPSGLNERAWPPLFMFPWWLRTDRAIYTTPAGTARTETSTPA